MVSRAINDKFGLWKLKEVKSDGSKIMMPHSYHSSNFSLLSLETMRLLVNMVRRSWIEINRGNGLSMENDVQSRSLEASTRSYVFTGMKQTPSVWYYFQQQPSQKTFLTKTSGYVSWRWIWYWRTFLRSIW